jgi:hypothetical protein
VHGKAKESGRRGTREAQGGCHDRRRTFGQCPYRRPSGRQSTGKQTHESAKIRKRQKGGSSQVGEEGQMTNAQLYLAIGVPIIVNCIFNGVLFIVAFQRMNRIEDKLDLLTGKIAEMDTEMGRIKERLGMK